MESSNPFHPDIPPENVHVYLQLLQEYSRIADAYEHNPPRLARPPINDHLGTLTFNVNAYKKDDDALIELCLNMFQHFDLLEKFQIPEGRLRYLLIRVKQEYLDLPYHNFLHAVDVTQFNFYLLTTCGLADYLSDLQIFALLLAALAHDIGHPGLQHSRTSLEEYHTQLLVQLMEEQDCQLFRYFPPVLQIQLRQRLTANIHATDMNLHFNTFSRYSQRIQTGAEFNAGLELDQHILSEISLKCSDLSNLVRPAEQVNTWAKAIIKEISLSPSEIKKHFHHDPAFVATSQIAFIDFIVKPLFGSLYVTLPKTGECLHNLNENRDSWNSQLFGASI